ncbi:Fanconi anemia core complex-associated protein 100 [Hyaena hyaena]|uniref:Fanconi anemia core complex-associated protein 100 n=1 Tax=Hyaena hyaena TaxID=95912 RepID=UPI001922A8CB|nr:Fanconi anemia core complex-associated protein 100 [Hyaena hyaena]XP_039082436.1 Fanconi anemia core complex-associated protein 100 [Hyaena hyaena]XP_039082437.1 Fanconi anemia core complex-associated protein 100 [Hyaena hyaena]XP_039082438.1 Fanconi anemia core complex-associated protein 100 [Hyaena hyaena]
MAGFAPRVEYLAGFRCPLGGLAAGKPRVLCHGAEIFVSTGSELVYVYGQEGRLLTAVYRFPGRVWRLELSAPRRVLYVLCAQKGVYCVSLDQASRSVSQGDADDRDKNDDSEGSEEGEPPCPVIPVDPDACILPDATLCAFTVLDDMLVTLAQGPAQWKVQLFGCPCPGEDARPPGQIGEVELSTCSPLAGSLGEPAAPHLLPVLCYASPPGCRGPHGRTPGSGGFTLERALFGLLFGVDASLLESPAILCGLPDGQLCCVVLKTLVTSRLAPGDPKSLVKILHHLEEPVVFIGALRTESLAEDMEDTHPDCLVALGHRGRVLAVKASWDEAGDLAPELREYRLPGPVLCAACGRGGRVYHSTPSGLCVVDLAWGGAPQDSVQPDGGPGSLPSLLCPAGLGVCAVVTLSVLSEAPEGGTRLLALSARGRLMTCSLDLSSEASCPTRVTVANTGQKIKELLSGIGTVSERVSSLKKAVDQRNKALVCLNEAMNVSCVLLASREGPRPISCTTTTAWSRVQLRDVLMATCRVQNGSGFSLGQGWTWCVQVLTSPRASDPDPAGSATTYTIPVDQLGPGDQREVTLPLGPSDDGTLDLPVTVVCALHYSLREVVGGALAPTDLSEDASLDGCPPDMLPEQEGICLPLSEHTVDMLQCLRFPGLATPPTQAPSLLGPAGDPVDTFLGTRLGPRGEPAGPTSLRAKFLPPSVATIKVSAALLRAALGDGQPGVSLGCAALQWLLAENSALDVVRARLLSFVQGVAPDGTDLHLVIREVTVTHLSAAGPLQAVEIQVESPSLATLCQAHHAVVGRLQRMVVKHAAQSSRPPDLRVQCLHQIQLNHEMLLREVQTLRDRLSTDDEASSRATGERLLQVYRQLRSPSLLLV